MNASAGTPRWVVDLKTRVVLECNAAAAEMWGYTPEEMIGMPAERLVHPDELERARAVRNEHISGDAGTWKCVRKDGSIFFLHSAVRRGVHEGKLCAVAEAIAS
jgi:PAS domain S-box-containing protein